MLSERLNTAQAAEFLNVKPFTVSQWRWQKKGPKYVKVGNKVFYFREHLEEWLLSNVRDNNNQEGSE
jgi:hypothetical protein